MSGNNDIKTSYHGEGELEHALLVNVAEGRYQCRSMEHMGRYGTNT